MLFVVAAVVAALWRWQPFVPCIRISDSLANFKDLIMQLYGEEPESEGRFAKKLEVECRILPVLALGKGSLVVSCELWVCE